MAPSATRQLPEKRNPFMTGEVPNCTTPLRAWGQRLDDKRS